MADDEPQPITVTVKVPFSSDLTVSCPPDVTVKRLLEIVMATCPPNLLNDTPQCIVHAGRILPDSTSLSNESIRNGAVVHLMRRPSHPPQSPAAQQSAGHNPHHHHHLIHHHNHHHHPPHMHHHHHQGHHHHHHNHDHAPDNSDEPVIEQQRVMTNVVIGHIALDGQVQFDDAHDVLASVLHALGLNPSAVSASAALAAAMAIANHSPSDTATASEQIRQVAWNALRAATSASSPNAELSAPSAPSFPADPPAPTEESVRRSESHPAPQQYAASVAAADVIFPALARLLRDAADRVEAFSPSTSLGTPLAPPSGRNNDSAPANADSDHQGAPNEATADEATNVVSSAPDQAQENATSSGGNPNETENVPSVAPLASASSQSVSEGRAQSSEAEGQLDAGPYNLVSSLSTAANALAASNALLASLLPDTARVAEAANPPTTRSMHERSRNANSSAAGTARGFPRPQALSPLAAFPPISRRVNMVPLPRPNRPGDAEATDSNGSATRPHNNHIDTSQGHPLDRSNESQDTAHSTEASEAPPEDGFNHGTTVEDDNDDSGNEHEHLVEDEEQGHGINLDMPAPLQVADLERNADYMVRLVSCYMASALNVAPLSTDLLPGEAERWTAARLLDEVYASRGQTPSEPQCRTLRVIHAVMDLVTPRQFDAVCRGDMSSLAPHRQTIWRIILESGRTSSSSATNAADDDDEHQQIEEMLDDVYDGVHDFVHKVERDARRLTGYEMMGEGTFCDVVMHEVQHMASTLVEIFTDNLSGLGEERWRRQFAYDLSEWFSASTATILSTLISELHLTWPQLVAAIRSALAEVGSFYFGERAAILLPLAGNLFVRRAKRAVDDVMPVDAPADTWHSNSVDPETNPEIAENENRAMHPDASFVDGDEHLATTPSSTASPTTRMATTTPAPPVVDLDEDELDALAQEMSAEFQTIEDDGPDTDLDALARELENEHSGPAKASGIAPAATTTPAAILPKPQPKRPSTSSVGGSFSRSSLGGGLSGAALGTAGRFGSASFASTAVPRAAPADEFDRALPPQEAARWRSTVEADETRVNTASYGPLSRAYEGRSGPVTKLDAASASIMAAENARAAAQTARLSEETTQQLEKVAAENGDLYLREFENAIASRVTSDPDFDPARFPNAAERFMRSSK